VPSSKDTFNSTFSFLINELSSAKKYRKAIKGGQFALFTIMGTSDWEDYASLSLQSLQLLTLANIDDNLEKIL
jgi:hypothetical protein